MSTIHGRLGAVAPSANTDTTLYTVPANTKATGTLFLCNRSGSDTTFRVAVYSGSVASADYLYYDAPLAANSTLPIDRLPLSAGSVLMVRFGSASCSANLHGIQEDV